MYERMRNDFAKAMNDANLPQNIQSLVLLNLDQVASQYDIKKKELALITYNDDLPEMAKTYIVCKKLEGLSNCTLETYVRMLKIFFREVRKPVETISPNDIRLFLYKYQKDRGCSNRSLDKYREYISGFFSWATNEGYLRRNPTTTIPAIKYERKQRQHLTQLELEYLRTNCKTPRETAIIEFLFSTGCRVSELCRVKISDVDFNTKSVHLFGKGQKHRTSFLNAKAEVTLRQYLETRKDDCEYLFVTERSPIREFQTSAVEKIVRNISQKTPEITQKNVTPHVLRHTTATLALQNGMPIADISKLLGHEKIDTTMVYAHTSTESVQAGHKKYII